MIRWTPLNILRFTVGVILGHLAGLVIFSMVAGLLS